jgi:hypothetical protein
MPIQLSCPSCAASIKAPDAAAGKTARCPKCKVPIPIPGSQAVAVVEPVEEEPVCQGKSHRAGSHEATRPAPPC